MPRAFPIMGHLSICQQGAWQDNVISWPGQVRALAAFFTPCCGCWQVLGFEKLQEWRTSGIWSVLPQDNIWFPNILDSSQDSMCDGHLSLAQGVTPIGSWPKHRSFWRKPAQSDSHKTGKNMSPAGLILQRFPDFRKLKKHVPACPYVQNWFMKTCLFKSAAGGDIVHSPGKLLSQRIQDIIGIQDKFNLLPRSLLICPKNSVCLINTVCGENHGYSHTARGKLRQHKWELIIDSRSEQLGLLCARPMFRLSG